MKKLLILAAAIFVATSASAQLNPMTPIPADTAVRVGELPNGMRYYIRHNAKPKNQADFYILHDVGAIQEDDSQQGLAHFLEHMAFNGTKNLPDKMLTEYLEKIGVKFGTNLNAGTSWDQTTYLIKDVPTVREGIIDSALLILHDWSHFITLDPKEIDSERGVIKEELRTRDGAQWRSMMEMLKAVGKGSKYEHRNLIGYLDGLSTFKPEALNAFYHQWYRPDYQAVVVVGDINVDQVEAKIKSLMSDIPTPATDASQKEVYAVPDNEAPIVSIYTDKEMPTSTIELFIKRPALPEQYNNLIYAQLFGAIQNYISVMENARLNEMAMQPDAPFLGGSVSLGSFGIVPTMDVTNFSVQTEDGKLARGFEAIYTEMEKLRRHGFTQGEFDRAQEILMRRAERAYANRNDRTNNEYVSIYLSNYLKNTAMPDAGTGWQLDSLLIKSVGLDDVNAFTQQLITPVNQVIVIAAPEKAGVPTPTEQELLAIRDKVAASEIAAYEDNTVKEPLIDPKIALKGSPVKTTTTNASLGTTEWTLKNGVKVIVKPTTFKADEVRLNISAKGGTALLGDDEVYMAEILPDLMSLSGISKFPAADLRKQLAGKTAAVGTQVNDYTHGMGGQASPKDIETMLQLVYLNFTAPRFDKADYETVLKMLRSQLENAKTNPDYIAEEHFIDAKYGHNPRRQIISLDIVDKFRFEAAQQIFDKLYPGANDFTFTFVGNVDLNTLKPLVEKYIGSIPVSKTKLAYKDDGARAVKGDVTEDFSTPMQQPKVGVHYLLSGKMPYTLENKVALTVLSQVLRSRYLTSIREEKGGTYSIGVEGSTQFYPEQTYELQIAFDTNEQMADELCEIVVKEIEEIAENGPKTEDVEKTREFLIKSWKNGLEQNGSWMAYLNNWYNYGLDYPAGYEKAVTSLTNADIQQMARKMLDDGNILKVIMRPEAAKTE